MTPTAHAYIYHWFRVLLSTGLALFWTITLILFDPNASNYSPDVTAKSILASIFIAVLLWAWSLRELRELHRLIQDDRITSFRDEGH